MKLEKRGSRYRMYHSKVFSAPSLDEAARNPNDKTSSSDHLSL